jgi:hypothetical protein
VHCLANYATSKTPNEINPRRHGESSQQGSWREGSKTSPHENLIEVSLKVDIIFTSGNSEWSLSSEYEHDQTRAIELVNSRNGKSIRGRITHVLTLSHQAELNSNQQGFPAFL